MLISTIGLIIMIMFDFNTHADLSDDAGFPPSYLVTVMTNADFNGHPDFNDRAGLRAHS